MKNRPFADRLGFALAGIGVVWNRERSFRTQCRLAVLALTVTIIIHPRLTWVALTTLSIGLVLSLEMINSALEYTIDHLHPDIAEPIKRAKDAAAGAVLIASLTSILIGAIMLAASLG